MRITLGLLLSLSGFLLSASAAVIMFLRSPQARLPELLWEITATSVVWLASTLGATGMMAVLWLALLAGAVAFGFGVYLVFIHWHR
jgi:hypothetical protein